TAHKDRKLSNLNGNIKCGNSLIDDPEVAGGKAFDWGKEFPEIMGNGGFDVVIGNPPYVFARDNISQEVKDFYNKEYQSAEYQVNTYMLFIERSIQILKSTGHYGLIVPNSWLMVGSATKLRKYILDNSRVKEIVNLSGYSFDNVNVETIIILSEKKNCENNSINILTSKEKEYFYSQYYKNQQDFANNPNYEFKIYSDDISTSLTAKLTTGSEILDNLTTIKAGLKAYEKTKGTPQQTAEDVKNRPFDFLEKIDENTYPYLEGKDVFRYGIEWGGSFLKYGKHLAAPRSFDIFSGEKIIIREITGKYPKSIIATYSDEIFLFNMSNIAIVKKPGKEISLKYITVLLNSQLLAFYFLKNTAKSVRKMFPKIILKDLRLFPIKEINIEQQQPFIDKADLMLDLNRQLQEKKNKFISRIQTNFEIEKITKKLGSFYDFDFKTFVAELKKQKLILSLSQQDEWEDYFSGYKNLINSLQEDIAKTDKEIDEMVYRLYGLSEEEVGIVEGRG
ncbi:MAG: N-6 DNA methylase, partial [Bacteroidales bacterium]|nr:N-6 DNA methylase [Bacteroidales bacterium]